MSKFKKGDLVVPSNATLSSHWWYYFKDKEWPQTIKSAELNDNTLETCGGSWNDIYLELIDEENE
ncbi:MAG: hypothetical protein ACRCVU_13855 [Flavobacterium sp.]